MAAADGYPELGLDGLCNIPVGAALAEADGGDPVAGDLEFEVGVGAAVSRTGYPEALSGDPDVPARMASCSRRVWGCSGWGDVRHLRVVILPLDGGCQGANPGTCR